MLPQNSMQVPGLSPLARGNLDGEGITSSRMGPIPARAGEPHSTELPARLIRAYPRSRGGTAYREIMELAHEGLSPLARGNRQGFASRAACSGPIPARAGEPSQAA